MSKSHLPTFPNSTEELFLVSQTIYKAKQCESTWKNLYQFIVH